MWHHDCSLYTPRMDNNEDTYNRKIVNNQIQPILLRPEFFCSMSLHFLLWHYCIKNVVMIFYHCWQPTFSSPLSQALRVALRGYLVRVLVLCPCRSLCFLQPSVLERPFSVSALWQGSWQYPESQICSFRFKWWPWSRQQPIGMLWQN